MKKRIKNSARKPTPWLVILAVVFLLLWWLGGDGSQLSQAGNGTGVAGEAGGTVKESIGTEAVKRFKLALRIEGEPLLGWFEFEKKVAEIRQELGKISSSSELKDLEGLAARIDKLAQEIESTISKSDDFVPLEKLKNLLPADEFRKLIESADPQIDALLKSKGFILRQKINGPEYYSALEVKLRAITKEVKWLEGQLKVRDEIKRIGQLFAEVRTNPHRSGDVAEALKELGIKIPGLIKKGQQKKIDEAAELLEKMKDLNPKDLRYKISLRNLRNILGGITVAVASLSAGELFADQPLVLPKPKKTEGLTKYKNPPWTSVGQLKKQLEEQVGKN